VRLKVRDLGVLSVPQRRNTEEPAVAFLPRETAGRVELVNIQPGRTFEREIVFDPVRNMVTRRISGTAGYGAEGVNLIPDVGLIMENDAWREHSIVLDDPCSMISDFHQAIAFSRDGWDIRVTSRLRVRSTTAHFLLNCEVDVYENEARVLSRSWNPRIPRSCV